MASVVEVPLDWYLDNILPPLPDEANIDSILDSLQRDSAIIQDLDDGSPGIWLAFWDFNDSDMDESEELFEVDILERLCIVFDTIIGATKQQMERVGHCSLKDAVSLQMVSDESAARDRSKPLADFVMDDEAYETEEGHPWHRMINPCYALQWHDLEKNDGEMANESEDPNDSFVLGAMQNILSKDPCRRFTFGTSIYGRKMRLWFANHAFTLKSEPFDLLTDHRRLIHLFVSLAFAQRSIDLGWDPSIARVGDNLENKQWSYYIRVDGQIFTTVWLLADYTAEAGRWTRVWLVRDCYGKPRVLKDVWVDERRQAEHEIREEMLQDVRRVCGDEECEMLKNHLLTPVVFEKVRVGGRVDSTARLQGREFLDTLEGLKPRHKFHYRIVFQEYATPVKDERWLVSVFDTLADVVKALEIIHRAGWVHRDISGGNLYSYSFAGTHRGLIGDFEFAKREAKEEPYRIVGTPDTIASEAASCAWLFRPRAPETGDIAFDFPFRYHFIHDLESIFWILVYVLFFNEDAAGIVCDPTQFQQRVEMREKLFPRKEDMFKNAEHRFHRWVFLKDSFRFDYTDHGLSKTLNPLKSVVSEIADMLVSEYRYTERSPNSLSSPNIFEIHEDLQVIFEDNRSIIASIRLARGVRIKTYGVVHIYERESRPRPAEFNDIYLRSSSIPAKKRKSRSDEYTSTLEEGWGSLLHDKIIS